MPTAKNQSPRSRSTSPAPPTAVHPAWGRSALGVQPKLAVGAPLDPAEAEADRVAAAVMRMPEPAVQRKCAACSRFSFRRLS
ncbi:MAG TPA: hypothetical protein VKM72_20405 [Thermoanaerobaculia bacterium]|nr:hypothetical protein [Thermoanaerobaculia bacterium]